MRLTLLLPSTSPRHCYAIESGLRNDLAGGDYVILFPSRPKRPWISLSPNKVLGRPDEHGDGGGSHAAAGGLRRVSLAASHAIQTAYDSA